MTRFSITHAYVTVGIAGVAAFVLLLLCGQHHSLAVAELGGTEVSAPASTHPSVHQAVHQPAKSGSGPQHSAARSTAAGLANAAASGTDLSSGFE